MRDYIIVTHTDNWAAIREAMDQQGFADIELTASDCVPKHPTAYRQPDGRVVSKQQIDIRFRFYSYGPEDFDFLLAAGYITEVEDKSQALVICSQNFMPPAPFDNFGRPTINRDHYTDAMNYANTFSPYNS